MFFNIYPRKCQKASVSQWLFKKNWKFPDRFLQFPGIEIEENFPKLAFTMDSLRDRIFKISPIFIPESVKKLMIFTQIKQVKKVFSTHCQKNLTRYPQHVFFLPFTYPFSCKGVSLFQENFLQFYPRNVKEPDLVISKNFKKSLTATSFLTLSGINIEEHKNRFIFSNSQYFQLIFNIYIVCFIC